jgi:hypothetical protein
MRKLVGLLYANFDTFFDEKAHADLTKNPPNRQEDVPLLTGCLQCPNLTTQFSRKQAQNDRFQS